MKSEVLDSVYFSFWSDPDIGNGFDDLVGYDAINNAGYCYQDKLDNIFGVNPPALYAGILETPLLYIKGKTYLDVNNNDTFDEGVDVSFTNVKRLNSLSSKIETVKGATEVPVSSFIHYIQSDSKLSDPNNVQELRAYMLGKTKDNQTVDPCSWYLGTNNFSNCSKTNPNFWYSGDPIMATGWRNNYPTDQRMMITCGPFKMEKNKSNEILVAYTVGRSTSALGSITEVKKNYELIKSTYDNGLVSNETDKLLIAKSCNLLQNYPNPFNPTTTIKFNMVSRGFASLKVYDIIGREVKCLVNGVREKGLNEVKFDATYLSSGIYFYRFETGNFTETKKMLLVK